MNLPTADRRARRTAGDDAPAKAARRFRPDIQGLRALAVLLVIGDHFFGLPRGGFIGVDIFFVISGFLITGLLLREHQRTGRISFRHFYWRRVRRILPAAMLVIAVTVIAAYLLTNSNNGRNVAVDGAWSTLSLANWHFAAIGNDYLLADGPVSPLRHYWSLSVEEQFYLVWPALIVAAGAVAALIRKRFSTVVLGLIAVVIVASFAWSILQTAGAPTTAYYSTFTRAWELAIGGLLAWAVPMLARLPRIPSLALQVAGLAGIAASVVAIHAGSAFPGAIAALPVLSAAALIAGGTSVHAGRNPLLENRVSRYIGDISYSLYLWHWPVLIVATWLIPGMRIRYLIGLLLLAFLLASLSYFLVERPIHERSSSRPERQRRRIRRIRAVALSVITATLVGAVATAAARPPQEFSPGGQSELTAVGGTSLEETLRQQLIEAETAAAWPELTPPIAQAPQDKSPLLTDDECFNADSIDEPSQCTHGAEDADKLAVVIGDSFAMSYSPGIEDALLPEGYAVRSIGFSQCPYLDHPLTIPNRPEFTERCAEAYEEVLEQLAILQPDLVVLANAEHGLDRDSGPTSEEWTQARIRTIDSISESADRVVVIEGPPLTVSPTKCPAGDESPADCSRPIPASWYSTWRADTAAAEVAGAEVVDTRGWFCDTRCPTYANGILIKWDEGHLTTSYSRYLAPLLRQALVEDAAE